jgi:sulfide:quinone oxidoreductase
MADVVIIGAGLAGVPCAYELRRQLAAGHRVTVVAPSQHFDFIPANPWLALGWRKPEETQVDLREPMANRGINLIEQAAIAINPTAQEVTLQDGKVIPYDQLVVAAGPVCAFHKIPGLGPASVGGHTQALSTHAQALEALAAWKKFPLNPGPVIVGVAPESAAFGPAVEFALMVDEELRRQKIRHLAPITFVTPEPYLGHFGHGEHNGSRQFVEGHFERRNIRAIPNARLNAIAPGALHLTRYNDTGIPLAGEELLFHYAVVFPSYRGPAIARHLPAACDSGGFLRVDAHQRCIGYPNVWAVGANVAAAPAAWTPVPISTPKIGRNIEGMVRTACTNIAASVAGQQIISTHAWTSQCLADYGGQGEVLGMLEKSNPATKSGDSGRWLQLVKIAYEKYFLDQVRDGVAGLPYQPAPRESLKASWHNGTERH